MDLVWAQCIHCIMEERVDVLSQVIMDLHVFDGCRVNSHQNKVKISTEKEKARIISSLIKPEKKMKGRKKMKLY